MNNPSNELSSILRNLATPLSESLLETSVAVWNKNVRYMICGFEIAPQTGTPHLQMYMEVFLKRSLSGMKLFVTDLGLPQAHLEMSNGTAQQNIDYCSKEGDFVTFGRPATTVNGEKQSTLCAELIRSGSSLKRIADELPEYFMARSKGIRELMFALSSPEDCDKPRDFVTQVKVYLGPTGTGKSREAHEVDKIQWTHGGDRWFDGYQGQEVVLFDDFAGVQSGITFRKLLQLTDRYPLTVPVKGGFVNWRPKLIIFTTNVEPERWYPLEDYSPLKRRVGSGIKYFK